MVKVFLEESAKLCIQRLDTLIKAENSYKIVCPNKAFIDKCVTFYPHLADKNLSTVFQLLSELGYAPIPSEIANVVPTSNPFLDPALRWMDYVKTLPESEQTSVKTWLKGVGFVSLD